MQIRLDAATVLLQWAVGGLAFCWFTTRRREVGLGYGWLLRGTYLVLAAGGVATAATFGWVPARDIPAIGVVVVTLAVLVISIVHRRAGVSGADAEHDRRTARVAEMTGIERDSVAATRSGREFDPRLDLVAPLIGVVGLVGAGVAAAEGGSAWDVTVSLLRTLAGAAFLGAVTDAMLLGHWYLVQPGLPRRHLHELVHALGWVWPFEVVALLLPVGMIAVWTGEVDDGWGGTLGWFWAACAITTIVLVFVTRAALKERAYSAVMAATGLLYLAILTAFGTDLVARAVLAG
jgi:heme exporter protein D